jgi:1-acyl-sn-glycerol-3-phosphate acyltransferase
MNRLFYHSLVTFGKGPVYAASQKRYFGREYLSQVQGALLVSNHPHYFDSMLIMGACPRPVRWLSMTEVSQGPFGWFFRLIGAVPLRRGGKDSAATRAMIRLLREGEIIGAYPEGRIQTGADSVVNGGPMGEGLFRLAALAGVPVIPCAVAGGEDFSKWTAWLPFRRTRWAVAFGPPIPPSDQTITEVRTALAALYRQAEAHVKRRS